MSDLAAVTYTFVNGVGNTADAAQVNQNYQDIIDYLNGRLGAGTPAQMLVADSAGKFTARTLSGDATISNTGALTVGPSAITAGKIGTLPACRLTKSASQSIPDATHTAVTFDTEVLDTDTMHSGSSSRITIVTAGVYLITAGLVWDANASGVRFATLRKNGTVELASDKAPNSDIAACSVTTIAKLAAADYIEVYGYQNRGGALQVFSSGDVLVGNPLLTGAATHLAATWMGKG